MRTLLRNLTDSLQAQSPCGSRVAVLVALLAGVVGTLRVTFNLGYNSGAFDMSTAHHKFCCVGFLESYLIPITACLFVSALGLWRRRAAGFITSLFALGLAVLLYLAWYRATQSLMPRLEVEGFSQIPFQRQRLLALDNANLWDLAVLTIIAVIFMWQLKVLLSALRSSYR